MIYKITIEAISESTHEPLVKTTCMVLPETVEAATNVDLMTETFKDLKSTFLPMIEKAMEDQDLCKCPPRPREREELIADLCLDCGKELHGQPLTYKPYGYK